MKGIVIYNSQTGFTNKYANWIADEAKYECVEFKNCKKKNYDDYDTIVFGGWACAGSISKIKWFKSKINDWNNKKLIVFCVGGSPIQSPDIKVFLDKCFTSEEHEKINVFYCPGGINYEKMPSPSKMMLKLFKKVCNSKKEKTEADIKMIEMLSSSYDISDKKYIEPIIDCINN